MNSTHLPPDSTHRQDYFPEEEEGGLDLTQFLYRLLRNWYWVVLGLAIALSTAYIKLRYSTNIYNISSSIKIDDEEKSGFSQEAIASELGFEEQDDMGGEILMLRSSDLMRDVVDSLGIHIVQMAEGRIKDSERYLDKPVRVVLPDTPSLAYGKTLRFRVLDEQDFLLIRGEKDTLACQFGVPFETGGVELTLEATEHVGNSGLFRIHIYPPQRIARQYARKIDAKQLYGANVIGMDMKDAVPEKGKDILGALVVAYNHRTREEKNEAGRNTLAFIDDRLQFITEELYSVERQVEGFKRSNEVAGELSGQATRYLDRLQTLDAEKTELKLQMDMLKNVARYLDGDAYRSLPVNQDVMGGTLNELVTQYNQLVFERENFLEAATPENPAVSTYEEQLNFIHDNIQLAVKTKREALETRMQTLETRMQPLEAQLQQVPTNERRLLQIMRQQQIKEQLFLFLLQKREETALSIAAQTTKAQVLEAPGAGGPVSPDRQRTYAIAFLLGLGIPVGGIYLRHFLDNKVRTQEDIRRETRMPFLGSIAEHKRGKEQLVLRKGSRSSVAEMFRLLRTNLQFNAAGSDNQVLLVTSTISGEGKTFVALNLGASQALSGKRTLLIGLDMRKPKLSEYLTGQRIASGITTHLVGEAAYQDVIFPMQQYENLHLMPCGPIPPNPAELLMQERLSTLMTTLRQEYDYIIIDMAPVGLVTDAFVLKDLVDQTLLVSRFGVTTRKMLKTVEDVYQNRKLPRPGILLNGVRTGRGYGYGYGYGYGHGYGYYEDEQKKNKRKWRFWA